GNITDLDYANEQVQNEQAKIDLAAAEAGVLDTREQLNALMGVWGHDAEHWTVAGRLPELPPSEISPAGLESLAVSQRLDLRASQQELEALGRQLGLTRGTSLIPELNVSGHVEGE